MMGKSHASSTKTLLSHEGFLWTTFSGVDGSWGHIVITYVQWIAHWVWKYAIFWSQCSTWSDWSQWKFALIRWGSITCARLGDTGNAWQIECAVAWGFVFSFKTVHSTSPWITIRFGIKKIRATSGELLIVLRLTLHPDRTFGFAYRNYWMSSSLPQPMKLKVTSVAEDLRKSNWK